MRVDDARRARVLPILVTLGLLVPAAVAGCTSSASAPDDLVLPVAVGLQRDEAGLQQWLQQAADPSSVDFLKPLTTAQVATQFGASPQDAATALKALQSKGFVGALDASGSILIGTMPANQAEAAFDVKIEQKVDNGVTYAYPSRAPKVPSDLSSVVADVAGLARTITGTGSSGAASAPATADVQCPGLADAAARMAMITGADGLRSSGVDGSGVRLAILEVAAVSQASLDAAKACAGLAIPPVTATLVGTTQVADLVPDSSEPVLDVLAASALAPGLDAILAYQFDPYSSIVFPLATVVGDALEADGPDILSTSIGFCEATQMSGDLSIAEWLLAVGAAGGLTTVASAGDTGSSACAPADESESVLYPATSAYATAVGGTTVATGSTSGLQQAVWNADGNAGGGAQTSTLPRPWYQASVPGPSNRIVPDVASVAAPSEFPPIPTCTDSGCQLRQVGGTSAAAPTVAAGLALVLQDLRQQRGSQALRLGLANPALYSLASGADSGALSDVTEGNNDLYSVGCCTAAVGYDPASGWGWLNFGTLARDYARWS